MHREGFVHHGVNLRFGGLTHRIDLHGLTGGRAITVYAQHEVLRDMIAAAVAAGRRIVFEAHDVRLHDLHTPDPRVTFCDDQLVRLHRIFDIYPVKAEAVFAFQSKPAGVLWPRPIFSCRVRR